MLVPVKWLKEYVDIDIDSKELADKLTMSGSHVDSIESVNKGVEKVVVGKILNIEKHPNADKLVITTIDVGEEKLQIVTGATNVKVGDYVPVALIGAKLPNGLKIRKSKLRGIESYGMLCSAEELGIDEGLVPKELKDGIYILSEQYPLGLDIKEALGLYGEVLEIEVTPNRPDCLSIIGMSRETAATLGKKLKYPEIKINREVDDITDYINGIEVHDKDLCKRYYARVVKDVKLGSSPVWIQRRLMEAGIRPINNIVDITNYVMLELGQPIHAFDLDKINGRKVIVRRAKEGEKIVTLDGVERELKDSMLVIADEDKPIAIAGVMGGENSEVSEETTTILIESANFNGKSVRLTSKGVGLRTEASARFEKDLDPDMVGKACDRVCQLIEEIGAGIVVKGSIDIYEDKAQEREITLRPEKVNNLLGIEIKVDDMLKILNSLELKARFEDEKIYVTIPTFRRDIELEADLIEEIGRIYGFDKIQSKPLIGTLTKGDKSRIRKIEDITKDILKGLGLNEITTYSFISPKAYDKINLPEYSIKRNCVRIMNPLGEDYSVMRTTLIPNMIEVLTRNYNYGVDRAWAYEIGNIFIPKKLPVEELPYEVRTLCIGMYGLIDFFDIKGIVDTMLKKLGITGCEYIREENYATFHPGRTANIIKGNNVLGVIGEIHPEVLENYGIKERLYIAELDFEIIAFLTNLEKKYKPLPKYPAINRDIALVVDKDIMVREIEKIIWENGSDIVENVKLFDVYMGKQIPEGKKSVAYSITYRSYEKTLTDEEVTEVHDRIVKALEVQLGASLR
ncbi:phenylalanyl-tRNA synthetase beta subunit [Caloranaerobacter azorensis DSM 13643]|uniref:Phenylalanine--tRNA ligase beta subunit n=1 Tax=Caloranaerobacter azorensis DSM 13643 TaxID=1121264 RepID=A0A1M5UV27_9FIRM|nr:phenylalanine--tRNA ligase subunit beta [Caloranaerobacter azorensis]SHH66796.1 phenylalanyl-tRNA synthetase beta subunit [Caloranaerobacter azorensis DSM 13643]